eukprot:jgi/Botrbrau1/500/Bobra.110_2s0130.1
MQLNVAVTNALRVISPMYKNPSRHGPDLRLLSAITSAGFRRQNYNLILSLLKAGRLRRTQVLHRQHRPYGVASGNAVPGDGLDTAHSEPTGRLILVDAGALMFRMHFGFGTARLNSSSGEDTSIAYGFLNVILGMLELRPPPTHFAVIFDAPGKTFRHELYPGYKGQRPPTPPDIKKALPRVREVLQALGIAQISAPGVEADDVIGTLSVRAVNEGFHVAIVSPDKDFFQLLRPGLQMLRPTKDKETSPLAALRGGFSPLQHRGFPGGIRRDSLPVGGCVGTDRGLER